MPSIRIERVTLNTLTYTAIRAPRPCSRLRLTNEDGSATITVRSAATDATTAQGGGGGGSLKDSVGGMGIIPFPR